MPTRHCLAETDMCASGRPVKAEGISIRAGLAALGVSVLLATPACANTLVATITTTQVISFAAFVATLAFSVVMCAIFMRDNSKIRQERNSLAEQLANLRAHSDRYETLIHADDQRLMIWSSGDEPPSIAGTLPESCGVPEKNSDFSAFGMWLTPASAAGLERSIAELRAEGAAFQLAVTTKTGSYLDAYGRTAGGRVFVRFRDLSGDQQVTMELRKQLAEKSDTVEIYQTMLEEIQQPVWLRDKGEDGQNSVQWANKAYYLAVNTNRNDKVQAELLDSEARQAISDAHGKEQIFKQRVNAVSNGARRTFDVVSVPTKSGSAGIATDVSEAGKAQAALSRTIESHEKTFNELATAVVIFDKDHKLTFHNNAYRDLFGLDEAFLASKPSDSEVIDKLRGLEKLPIEANFRQWKNNLLKIHQSVELQELTWHLPDGQTLRVVASPRSTGGVTWIYENLTMQLNLESRVNVLSRLQGETLNRLSDGVAVFSSNGQLTLSNSSFAEMWRLDDPERLATLTIKELAKACVNEQGCEEHWNRLTMAVVGVSDKREDANGIMERPNGSVLRYSTNVLIDGSTMLMFVDISDSVNVERALREKNEALSEADNIKNEFVQHVNYELRSPLTNIIGFAQLLSDADIGPLTEKQQEYTDYIMSSSSSLLAIINDILDLATADAGITELTLGKVTVQDTINGAMEGLKDRLIDRNIELIESVEADIGTFIGDEQRLMQILFNLLSNAIKYSDQGSKISLNVARDNGNVVFKVQDWGAGIPASFINQVFGRFASQKSGSVNGGAGLGLSIVKRFVELHNGNVFIESEEGVGTLVTCVFPAEPALEHSDAAE